MPLGLPSGSVASGPSTAEPARERTDTTGRPDSPARRRPASTADRCLPRPAAHGAGVTLRPMPRPRRRRSGFPCSTACAGSALSRARPCRGLRRSPWRTRTARRARPAVSATGATASPCRLMSSTAALSPPSAAAASTSRSASPTDGTGPTTVAPASSSSSSTSMDTSGSSSTTSTRMSLSLAGRSKELCHAHGRRPPCGRGFREPVRAGAGGLAPGKHPASYPLRQGRLSGLERL